MKTTNSRALAWTRCLIGSVMLAGILQQGCGDQAELGQGSESSVRGELSIRVADYQDRDPSLHYFLATKGGASYELVFPHTPELQPGAMIEVKGARDAGDAPRIVVDSFSLIEDPAGAVTQPLLNAPPKTDYSVAVLMVHWGAPDSMTTAGLKGKIFTNSNSTSNYMRETSYGIQGLRGDVFGWYQIANPAGCNEDAIATSARNAASAAGVNLSNYKQVMYYFPKYSSCSWAGLAQIGSPSVPARDSWYNGYSDCVVLSQELAHNWGLLHSRSCTSSLPSGSGQCTTSGVRRPVLPDGERLLPNERRAKRRDGLVWQV